MFVFHSMQPWLLLLWQQMHWVLSPSPRHGHVCLSAVGPCNADACNDTIPLGINRLPLLAPSPPSSQKKSGGKVGKEGRRFEGNLSAACFAAIKTTEVELLPKRKAGRKEAE